MKGRIIMKHITKHLSALFLAALLLALATACTPAEGTTPDAESAITDTASAVTTTVTSATASDTSAETIAASVNYAPDFEVLDENGNTVKLSDFRGKPVVLNFWATWCPPCKAELPDFNQAAKDRADEVSFLMVNLTDGQNETVEGVKAFVLSNGYTFPVYFDTKYSAANAYRVSSIPTTYFISAEGEIVAQKVGMMSAAELERGIKLLTE